VYHYREHYPTLQQSIFKHIFYILFYFIFYNYTLKLNGPFSLLNLLDSIFVQAPPADFCKKHIKGKKIHTYRYSLKYKKLNMQISQLWSVVIFFLLKINRLFLIRDANFNIFQKKKNRRIQDFLHNFFQEKLKIKLILILILKNNSNLNNFKDVIGKKCSCFRNMPLENRIFSKKRYFAHLYTKKSLICAGTVG
jgi:hypothetical protein